MDDKIKYILKIGICVLLILAVMNILGINLNGNDVSQNSSLLEGFVLEIQHDTQNLATGANAFCDLYRGSSSSLNNECRRLTEKNCNETSCCVFTNNKCVAGGANGPTYNTNSNLKIINADYYFQNQCYGANCPSQ